MVISVHVCPLILIFQEVKDALGNIADLEKFSRDIVRDASEAGPSGSSLFTDTTPVTPLESAEDFTEITELADDSENFKVGSLCYKKLFQNTLCTSLDYQQILTSILVHSMHHQTPSEIVI